MEHLQLAITGMTCGGCVRTLERKLSATPGVQSAKADLPTNSAQVDYDPSATNPDQILAAVSQVGFEARIK